MPRQAAASQASVTDGEQKMALPQNSQKWLKRKARKGFRGYPMATVAFYGPDDKRATKVAVGIITHGDNVEFLERWFSDESDVRSDPVITQKVVAFITEHGVKTVGYADQIIGCPHEEGADYPEGATCPKCLFWAGHDRWTGQPVN